MRISTLQMYQQGINSILNLQAQVNKTQQQLASGSRVNSAADDPVAAVQILDMTEDLSKLEGYTKNGEYAQGDLARQETAIQDAVDLLQRARELVVTANNGSQTTESRQAIAAELQQLNESLLAVANTRDASGDYLFGGYQSGEQPFSRNNGVVTYNGDEGGREIEVADGVNIRLRDSGRALFMGVPTGNGTFDVKPDAGNSGTAVLGGSSASTGFLRDEYTISFAVDGAGQTTYSVSDSGGAVVASGHYAAGENISFNGAKVQFSGSPAAGDSFTLERSATTDMFGMMQGMVDALSSDDSSAAGAAQVHNAMASALGTLDQALGGLVGQQTQLGARMNQADTAISRNEAFSLQLQQNLSEVRDLDYAEAISRLQMQLTTLEAAQKSYVSISNLSLFDYL
ncbi:MAG: flagellar hook-associated protein FlgL [Parahaliea sp.]